MIGLGWVGFDGISTNIGHLMPNPVYTLILNIYSFVSFYGILINVGHLMTNPVHIYILDIYNLYIIY